MLASFSARTSCAWSSSSARRESIERRRDIMQLDEGRRWHSARKIAGDDLLCSSRDDRASGRMTACRNTRPDQP